MFSSFMEPFNYVGLFKEVYDICIGDGANPSLQAISSHAMLVTNMAKQ